MVVVYDASWNVSNDLQAQDRAYRIGQTKFTQVYRLVSSGTIEEMVSHFLAHFSYIKIYNRQVYKQQLAGIGLDRNNERRLFEGVAGMKGQEGELFGLLNLLRLNAKCVTEGTQRRTPAHRVEIVEKAREEEKQFRIEEEKSVEEENAGTKEPKPLGEEEFDIQELFAEDGPNEYPTNEITPS